MVVRRVFPLGCDPIVHKGLHLLLCNIDDVVRKQLSRMTVAFVQVSSESIAAWMRTMKAMEVNLNSATKRNIPLAVLFRFGIFAAPAWTDLQPHSSSSLAMD
jgi:hypothetical protein